MKYKLGYKPIKNHFEEVELKHAPVDFSLDQASAWSSGYNYCLSKTNPKELLEALKYASRFLLDNADADYINNAIKKATE